MTCRIARTLLAPAGLPLLLVAACSDGDSRAQGAASGRPSWGAPVPVAVVEIHPRDLARAVTVTGPVEPIRAVEVSSQTNGTLLTVRVEEGDRVAVGGLLAELDSREVSAQLERATAALANAEAGFHRARGLRTDDLISEAELDASRSAFEMAKADASLWSTRLAFCRITAPVAGVVTAKHVEEGSTVSTGNTLFEIADDSVLVVRVRVSELDVVHLTPGTPVTLELDAYPGREIGGRIRRIFPAADATSRLVPVEVQVDARPPGVDARPGFLARVVFALDRRESVLAVPTAALGNSGAGTFVYVVQADTLAWRSVATGLTAAGWIEIPRGLEPGERVVTSGQVNLSPGTPVRVHAPGGASADSVAEAEP